MIWELPKNKIPLSVRRPDQEQTTQPTLLPQAQRRSSLLPWMVMAAVLISVLGVGIVAQIVLMLMTPYARPFGFNLMAVRSADYSAWDSQDNPGLAALIDPGLDPELAAASDDDEFEEFIEARVEVVNDPSSQSIIHMPGIINLPGPGAVQVATEETTTPTPTATPTPSPSPTVVLPSATPTVERSVPTRTPRPTLREPTSTPQRPTTRPATATNTTVVNRPPAVPPTSLPGRPTARPTSTPRPGSTTEPGNPTAVPTDDGPPRVFTTTPTSQPPAPTSTPVPENTPTPGDRGTDGMVSLAPGVRPGEPLNVQVEDVDLNTNPAAAETVSVTLINNATGETEQLVLTENAIDSELFAGVLPTQFGTAAGTSDDGRLTVQAGDTVTVRYEDSLTGRGIPATLTDTITILGGNNGVVVITPGSLPGEPLRLGVVDADLNTDPLTKQTVTVSVVNEVTGEMESAELVEISNNNAIFLGDLATRFDNSPGASNNNVLVIRANDTVTATYVDELTSEGGTANVTDTIVVPSGNDGMVRITRDSRPGDPLIVTVSDADVNADSGVEETVEVTLVNDATGESETLTLTEITPNDNFFKGVLPTTFGTTKGPNNDGVLTVEAGDQVTATYIDEQNSTGGPEPVTDSAVIASGSDGIVTLSGGQPGDPLELGVVDADLNTDAETIEDVDITIVNNATGETETVTLSATGPNSEFFLGSLPTTGNETAQLDNDGLLFVQENDTVTATYIDELSQSGGSKPVTETITIQEVPTVQFSRTTYLANEGEPGATAIITAALNMTPTRQITVDYATSAVTETEGVTPATPDEDYTNVNGTLTFAAGEIRKTFTVPIIDDNIGEAAEDVALTLSNPTRAKLGERGVSTLTILDDDTPTVQFAAGTASVDEGAGTATITATLSNRSDVQVKVNYLPDGGTAIRDTDYSLASETITGTIVFAPGETSKPITVSIRDDELDEDDETINMVLANPVDAELGAPTGMTLTIVDNDVPQVQFNSPTYSVREDEGQVTISVTMDISSTRQITVNYATSDGSARAGSGRDYLSASGILTFTAGQTSQSFDITINSDTLDEVEETFNLTLSNPTNGASLGTPKTATVTIDDSNKPRVSFNAADADVDVGEGIGTKSIRVELDIPPAEPVTVNYELIGENGEDDRATEGDDYTDSTGGTLIFNPNVQQRLIQIGINNDELVEADEDFDILLSSATNATLGSPSQATVTIEDNDVPTVQFERASYSVTEGDSSDPSAQVVITANLSTASEDVARVAYRPGLASTATENVDYLNARGVLTFAAGDTEETFTVDIIGDDAFEGTEELVLVLESPEGATLGTPGTTTVEIADNDLPTLKLSSASVNVSEGAGQANFDVVLAPFTDQDVTVNYATGDGTAIAGSDYVANTGTLTFTAGGPTTQTISVPITNDTTDEPNETFTLTLSDPVNAELGTPITATATIEDDDSPEIQFSKPNYQVREDGSQATITVTMSSALTEPVTANYRTDNDSAIAGSDYMTATGTVTFTAGQTRQTFTVDILDDDIIEPTQSLNLTLESPSANARIVGQSTATLTIVDDDVPNVQFALADIQEGEDAGTVNVEVTLDVSFDEPVSVEYASLTASEAISAGYTLAHPATAGDDYQAVSGTLNFAPGETSKTFSVQILDDSIDEFDEQFVLELSNPTNAELGSDSAAIFTILDNDLPAVTFGEASYSVNEAQSSINIDVQLGTSHGEDVTVTYATSDGTATAGSDYVANTGTLTFTAGTTLASFSIEILDDNQVEDPITETVTLTLSNPTNAVLGSQSTATLMIEDDDEPKVQFDSGNYDVDESAGQATITVELNVPARDPVSVDYATFENVGDDAAAGSDYDAASGTLNFATGEITKTFTVGIRDDGDDEPNETLSLRLDNLSDGLQAGPRNEAQLTILDNDVTLPLVQFSEPSYQVVEDQLVATITVTLDITSTNNISVDYATSNGTAIAGSDYMTTTGMLTFAPGETSQSFTIPLVDDGLYEPDETLTLTLSNVSGATLTGDPTATLTIVDDLSQPVARFGSPTYQVSEANNTAMVTVTLSAPLADAASVDYATGGAGDTAEVGSDYVATNGNLDFAAGETVQVFAVTIRDDVLDEADEGLTLTLSDPAGVALPGDPTATLTIIDDDASPVIEFSESAYQVSETDSTATITVALQAQSGRQVTVDYTTNNGTAIAGSDYMTATGTLIFAVGETSQSFSIPLIDDDLYEPDETLTLTLSNVSGATLPGDPTATLTIEDDLSQPIAEFGEATYQVNEADGTATVTVTLTVPLADAASVDYATGDASDTAEAGSDYDATSGTLSFATGELTRTFTVDIRDDSEDEPDETLTLTLSNPAGVALAGDPTATLTIEDDDIPTVQFVPDSYSISEADSTVKIDVSLDTSALQPVTVDYATSDGTAEAWLDYVPVSGTLTFTPGETLLSFNVPISDDIELEADEDILLSLTNPTYAMTGTSALARLEIIDDEPDSPLVGLLPDVPDNFNERYFQTNGPKTNIARGDWYGSEHGGSKPAGDHYLEITIPDGWPASLPIEIELFSPEMGSDTQQDENRHWARGDTTFALYGPGTNFVPPDDDRPGYHDSGSELFTETYAPSSDPGSWQSFYTISAPVSGTYLLRSQSRNDSENKWGVRLLYDHDDNPATLSRDVHEYPDGPDGQPGTGDEVVLAIRQVSLQYKVTSMPGERSWCQNFYQFVEPGASEVAFHNYDTLYGHDTYVLYRSPGNRVYMGTTSIDTRWNGFGATTMHRVGDKIINPEPGWWVLQVCTDNLNQFIQEGQCGEPIYMTQPPTPDIQVSMTSEKMVASKLRYTITLTNTSDTGSAPGVAQAITLTSQDDPVIRNVNACTLTGALSGTCDYDNATDTLTVTFDGPLAAGDSASVEFTAIFAPGASGEITGTVSVDYEDMLGNRYAPATATDQNNLP